jgi:hypothetical protein
MALRDNNRYRKIYPFIRRKPFNVPEGNVTYESSKESVSAVDQVTINFTTTFTSAPFVTATAYDSASNNQANVNTYIISVSTTQVVIGFSAAFTGEVHYHAIQAA